MESTTVRTDNIPLIDNLRFLLLLGVILIHCNISSQSAGSGADIVDFISSGLCSVCVPFYFLISAFLFFRSMDKFSIAWYRSKIRRRVRSLLLPYLLWNTIGLATMLLKIHLSSNSDFTQYDNLNLTVTDIIKGFWSLEAIDSSLLPYPYDFVLWFVRDLIVLTFAAPLFYLTARYAGWICFSGLLILSAVDTGIHLPVTEIFFFYSGTLLAMREVNVATLCRIGKWFAIPALLLALIPETIGYPDIVNPYFPYILTAIPALCWATCILINKFRPIPRNITAAGFFIYAFHGLYVTVASRISISLIYPDSLLACIGCYIFDFCLILSVATISYILCRRFMPRFTTILSGGRS